MVLHFFLFALLTLTYLSTVVFSETQLTNRTLLTDAANNLGAVCLDGTPGAYYLNMGSESNKWVLYFEGGGWCGCLDKTCSTGFDTCYARSKKYHGSSSTQYSQNEVTMDLNSNPGQMLSNSESLNPLMYNWNHVFVHYCDGGSFGGNLADGVNINGDIIYYRGFRILDALFMELRDNYNLGGATDFVITGGSAGGLTTYLHSNYISDNYLSNTKNVYSMPDCGFFMDYNGVNGVTNYSNGMKWVYSAMNVTTDKYCINYMKQNNKDENLCIFAPNVAPHINIALYALQSQYDSWQVPNILGSTDTAEIDAYGQNLTLEVESNVLNANSNRKGGSFLVSCYSHCGLWDKVHINGTLEDDSFSNFYSTNNEKLFYFQNDSYPCQNCCQ